LELVFSKADDGPGHNEDDNDGEDWNGEVFTLSASVVRGITISWIVGDMMEGISSSDDGVEQMEETLLLSSRESSFKENAEGGDADEV
jgi:hypothetical protein